ncbi:MAG: LamG domain-containing protein [Planctomycetes bacterium]|nr:LamG domain-containing protein [Planctomycetota bacterium]
MRIYIPITIIFSFFLVYILYGSVRSTNNIEFDVQADGDKEMTLSTTGLGIGVIPTANLHVDGNVIISESLTVGSATAASANLYISGSISMSSVSVSSSANISGSSMYFASAASSNVILNLPYAGNFIGQKITIKKTDGDYSLWVTGGGNNIDSMGVLEYVSDTGAYPNVEFLSDGSQWYIISSSHSASTLSSANLLAWYKLDETSGTQATDSSGRGNHGTLVGAASFASVTGPGKVGTGLVLTGSEYIDIGEPSDIEFTGEDFSISAWAKTDFDDSWMRIVGADVGGGNSMGYALRGKENTTSKFSFRFTGATSDSESSSAATDTGWHHLVGIHHSGNNYLYLDGELEDSDSASDTSPDWASIGTISIGSRRGSNSYIGTIDDVRFYNKVLNQGEIEALYLQGR